MRRSVPLAILAAILCALPVFAQRQAEQPPAGLQQALDSIVVRINKRDSKGLAGVITGDPKRVFWWQWRPGGGAGMPIFGMGDWKAGAIHEPYGPWRAVFWQVHPCESEGDHVHRVTQRNGAWMVGAEMPETDPLGYRFTDHKIDVTLDPPTHTAAFTDDARVVRLGEGARTLQFRITPDFPVDAVSVGGKEVPFTEVGSVVYIPAPLGREFTLHLAYHGAVQHRSMFVGNYVDPKETVLAAYWYPVIARLPTTHTDVVTAPKDWTVVAQGNLVSHTAAGDTGRWTYRMDVPNCYFTLDAGPYHVYERTVYGRTYGCYTLVADDQRAVRQTGLMDASFRLFEDIWGAYPFNHYTIVETQQDNWPGALESYTFTTYGKGLIPSPNPHEWGHTWWGGFVPNTYLHDIWNESFATYSESVYERYGDDSPASPELRNRLLWHRPFAGMDKLVAAEPLDATADSLYGPSSIVGYGKGQLVMQNLEATLGAETLWRCMKTFREEYDGSRKAATWRDFERVVDRVAADGSGRYRWWFDQWVRRTGLPALSWSAVTSTPASRDGFDVRADIVQTGKPYRLSVPVWLETADGNTVRTVAAISGARTRLRMHANAAPKRLLLDPNMRLPRAITQAEVGSAVRGPQGVLVVVGAAGGEIAKQLAGFGLTVKKDVEVTDADLKSATVVLAGGPQQNKVWARFADRCPFTVEAGAIRFDGRTYPGAEATGTSANPLDPQRHFVWLSAIHSGFGLSRAPDSNPVLVTDQDGRVIDGEEPVVQGGASVYTFK